MKQKCTMLMKSIKSLPVIILVNLNLYLSTCVCGKVQADASMSVCAHLCPPVFQDSKTDIFGQSIKSRREAWKDSWID